MNSKKKTSKTNLIKKKIQDLKNNKIKTEELSVKERTLIKKQFDTNEMFLIQKWKNNFKIPYINIDASNKKVLVKVDNLTKIFNKNFVALDNLSFQIRENENLAILGGNGAGKTTLVEIIAGLNKATKGHIEYNLEQKNYFQEKIGIQFQNSSYPTGIKVKRVIKFVLDIYNAKLNKNEIIELIDVFGLKEFYNKNASSLSGGQQQRLNALLAILHKPKLMILDELSTGLDILIRNKIKRFIKNYAKQNNITILIISHDMDEVAFLAERIIMLSNGKIIYDDSKKNALNNFGSLESCFEFFNNIKQNY